MSWGFQDFLRYYGRKAVLMMSLLQMIVMLAGLVLLVVAAKVMLTPIKFLLRIIINGVAGLILLFLVNLAGSLINFHIGLNPVTILVAGFLGIPGVLLLAALQFLLR